MERNLKVTMKNVLITGITGQDGVYLAKLLLEKGYSVFGCSRRISNRQSWRLQKIGLSGHPNFKTFEIDITDFADCMRAVRDVEPDEIYNLAAQSYVKLSFDQPIGTSNVTGLGALNLLEVIKNYNTNIKFYQASTSEMFGEVVEIPQSEATPFVPQSPYAVAKLYAHWMTRNYSNAYNIFGSTGILFNHESPIRGEEFVTRKITLGVANLLCGNQSILELGNLNAKRDWGFAPEYVEGMWRILQHDEPDDFVLATGTTHSIRSFLELTFKTAEWDVIFEGHGIHEAVYDKKTGRKLVQVNAEHFRAAEVDLLVGNAKKAKDLLGWEYQTSLEDLVGIMFKSDLEQARLISG